MQNDGLDRRVVIELLEFVDHRLRGQNHALKIDHADAVAEAGEAGLFRPACSVR